MFWAFIVDFSNNLPLWHARDTSLDEMGLYASLKKLLLVTPTLNPLTLGNTPDYGGKIFAVSRMQPLRTRCALRVRYY